jgi:hypothetical protein
MNGLELDQKLSKSGICLTIQGMGHVPSFKNQKTPIPYKTKSGKRAYKPMTRPRVKLWMEKAIHSIVSQLSGLFPTEEGETLGECQKRLQTALCLPLDDSLEWMIPGPQSVRLVNKCEEGAIIIIEEITPGISPYAQIQE